MTQEEIIAKAYEAYPTKKVLGTGANDHNAEKREGYIKALTELMPKIESLQEEINGLIAQVHINIGQYENLPKLYEWVARDKNGDLHLFEVEPTRSCDDRSWFDRDYNVDTIDKEAFPYLTWEDDPVQVEVLIREL